MKIYSVSQQILGRHWKQRTPAEQREFIVLLSELFAHVAYPKSAEFFGDLDIQVTDERMMGKRAVVKTTVSDPQEGLISVDYKMQQHQGTWRIQDIILDDVSLARNLRSQVHQIITEHSYLTMSCFAACGKSSPKTPHEKRAVRHNLMAQSPLDNTWGRVQHMSWISYP